MNRVRTALIGCGKVGQIHAAALSFARVGVRRGLRQRARREPQAFAARYRRRPFTDVRP